MAASWKGGIVPDAAVRRARRDQRSTAMRPVAVAERVVMAGWYHGRPGERRCRHQKAVLDRPPTLHDEAPNHLSPPRGRGLHGTTCREAIQAQPSMWGAFPEKPYRIRPHRRLSSIPARGERWGDRLAPGSPGTNEGPDHLARDGREKVGAVLGASRDTSALEPRQDLPACPNRAWLERLRTAGSRVSTSCTARR